MEYDPQAVETRWRERWAEAGRYEATPDPDGGAEKTFVTVPYPYPSGGMHVGHARTYTVPDVYARYRRQQGDAVCFPIAWHVTGTPIVGAVERLKKGEEAQLALLQDTYGVPREELVDLETPMGYARYFVENHYKPNMRALGLSIDWRREFTTNDDRYSRFVTWQYETLREHGRLERGLHPVKYCTEELQPVTTHDLLEGEAAEFQEYTLVKFAMDLDGERVVAPMATLRPETVRGVTNAFVHPEGTYVRATVDGEAWLVSTAAARKFRLQERDVDVHEELPGEALVGQTVENPVTGEETLVLPATFVDTENATGVVMSVPAHSPDDYVALREAKADADALATYGIDPDAVRAIEPVPILELDDYGEIPARGVVEAAGIESTDDPALADVTADLYRAEFHTGRLLDSYGEFAGETVADVREAFRDHHREAGAFDAMYEFSEDVVCRCGGDVEVANQETWFIDYGDDDWKAAVHEAVDDLDAVPDATREQYHHTVDWLDAWPCIRNYGLGTRLPWDDDFVIEPLSDSTVYMAYYTVAHRLDDVPPSALDRAFFDALFFGPDAVEDPDERALRLRDEFDYWYPVDYRCSATDLIPNHLTFYLFHHVDLFDREHWPQGITAMGMGLLEGEKMSSSSGHVVLPSEAIDEYGADTVRLFLLNAAEPWQDFDWRADEVGSTRDQLDRFWHRATEVVERDVPDGAREELRHVDRWLLARLQETVRTVTESLDRFETRTASQAAFHGLREHLQWYRRRADLDHPGAAWTLQRVLTTRLRLLAPFVPFLANELHEALVGIPAEDAPWPEPDPAFESRRTLVEEELVERLTADVHDIVDVTGTDPGTVRVYVAADWKRRVFEVAAATAAEADDGPDVGTVMSRAMQYDSLRDRGDAVSALVSELLPLVRERDAADREALREVDETAVYEHAAGFLAREFDAAVEVYAEDDDPVDPGGKAGQAEPFRPAVHIE